MSPDLTLLSSPILSLQTHEYAMDTMKFVVSLKVQRPLSPDELDDIQCRLKTFTQKHPAISQTTLVKMTSLAAKLSTSAMHKRPTVDRFHISVFQCN